MRVCATQINRTAHSCLAAGYVSGEDFHPPCEFQQQAADARRLVSHTCGKAPFQPRSESQ